MWLHHMFNMVIYLVMELHLLSLSISLPESSCCKFYGTGHDTAWRFDADNMGVASIYSDLISYTCTSKYTYKMTMILKIIKAYNVFAFQKLLTFKSHIIGKLNSIRLSLCEMEKILIELGKWTDTDSIKPEERLVRVKIRDTFFWRGGGWAGGLKIFHYKCLGRA